MPTEALSDVRNRNAGELFWPKPGHRLFRMLELRSHHRLLPVDGSPSPAERWI